MRWLYALGAAALLSLPRSLAAQAPAWRQTDADAYTRYELLDPASHSFHIVYDITATTAGARYYFNGIREGAEEVVYGVIDRMSGDSLPWEVVDGGAARALGMRNARPDARYIQVTLLRPVPEGGEVRLRIDKTYRDTASYYSDGGDIVFDRLLGIRRNAVVLPAGYELVAVNHPSQVLTEPDGRIKVSFMNHGAAAVPYRVRARPLPAGQTADGPRGRAPQPTGPTEAAMVPGEPTEARVDHRVNERAFQDREIVYFLDQPETHSFHLYHDYTESRPGVDRYVNVVRAGSKATEPSAVNLDTGRPLKVETLRGADITRRGVDLGEPVTPATEVVVIWFDPVEAGHSTRLRIEETYTDPGRYVLAGDALVWDRSFGRPRNVVVLPAGWYLTANEIPAVVDETEDGRLRLDYWNDRPDQIRVFITARRR